MKPKFIYIIVGILLMLSSWWIGSYLMNNLPEYQFAGYATGCLLLLSGLGSCVRGVLDHDFSQ